METRNYRIHHTTPHHVKINIIRTELPTNKSVQTCGDIFLLFCQPEITHVYDTNPKTYTFGRLIN